MIDANYKAQCIAELRALAEQATAESAKALDAAVQFDRERAIVEALWVDSDSKKEALAHLAAQASGARHASTRGAALVSLHHKEIAELVAMAES